MDSKTFEKYIHIYGSDLSRWPEHLAKELSAVQDQGIANEFAQQLTLDKQIQSWQVEPPSGYHAQLKEVLDKRVLSTHAPLAALLSPLGPKFIAMSFACVLGLAIGFMTELPQEEDLYFDNIALGFEENDEL